MTPGPKQATFKLHKVNPFTLKATTPMPGQVQFGAFKARQVPKSLYERPSKKKQALNLKSASKSVCSEDEYNCQSDASPFTETDNCIVQEQDKENYSTNPQTSQQMMNFNCNFSGMQNEQKNHLLSNGEKELTCQAQESSNANYDFRNTKRNIFGTDCKLL